MIIRLRFLNLHIYLFHFFYCGETVLRFLKRDIQQSHQSRRRSRLQFAENLELCKIRSSRWIFKPDPIQQNKSVYIP
jgi:hypothetical protein